MSKIGTYFKESYDELVHKVSWPTFAELRSSAVVVAVAALILAVVIFLMDWVMGINVSGYKGILGYIYEIIAR
ncbi:MAG: preprotein translocase subunit SecE [Bacteroidales bacterium]|nr:preprotein translocase subunit SecE [Bacteroidales bacterium]